MAVTPRKVSDDVQKIFDKYVGNHFRRLKKDTAYEMFQKEFDLSEEHAKVMFDIFDKDQNDELSIWEFQQFYTQVGHGCHDILKMYKGLAGPDGEVDISRTFDVMQEMKTPAGRKLKDEEVALLLQTAAGPEKAIDLPKFINMMLRLKLFRD